MAKDGAKLVTAVALGGGAEVHRTHRRIVPAPATAACAGGRLARASCLPGPNSRIPAGVSMGGEQAASVLVTTIRRDTPWRPRGGHALVRRGGGSL